MKQTIMYRFWEFELWSWPTKYCHFYFKLGLMSHSNTRSDFNNRITHDLECNEPTSSDITMPDYHANKNWASNGSRSTLIFGLTTHLNWISIFCMIWEMINVYWAILKWRKYRNLTRETTWLIRVDFSKTQFSLVPRKQIWFPGRRSSEGCSPHRDSYWGLLFQKPDFHWFSVSRYDFEVNECQIRVPRIGKCIWDNFLENSIFIGFWPTNTISGSAMVKFKFPASENVSGSAFWKARFWLVPIRSRS
jgi:hypothetical protein